MLLVGTCSRASWPETCASCCLCSAAHVSAIGGCASSGVQSTNQGFDNAGLFDEIHIDLVPFLPGDGARLFDHLKGAPVVLEDPQASIGKGAIHLTSRIVKEQAASLLRLA